MASHISLLDMMDMIRVDGQVFGQLTAIKAGSVSVSFKRYPDQQESYLN
jgi:hypothetical protein